MLLITVHGASATLNDGLVYSWQMEGLNGSAVIVDSMGAKNLSGSTSTLNATGKIDSGMKLNGTTNYASATGFTQPNTAYTISFWINRTTQASSNNERIIDEATGSNVGVVLAYRASTGKFALYHDAGGWSESSAVTSAWFSGGLKHIVATWNGTHSVWYIEGVVNTTNAYSTALTSATEFYMGRTKTGTSPFETGIIDEVAIWNRSLSASEVSQLYNSGAGYKVPIATSSNFTLSATNTDGGSLNNFSATINGTNYTTTTGTINTTIALNSGTINITVYNAIDGNGYYYNQTYYNVNTTTAYTATNLYQVDVSLSAYQLITNMSLTGTYVTGTQSSTNRLQLTAGTKNIIFVNTSYFNTTSSFTYTALSNTSSNITGVYDAYINLTVKDVFTNASLNNFTGYYYNSDYSYNQTINNTVNTSVVLPIVKNLNWTVFAENNAYAITNFSYQTSNITSTVHNLTIYLYATNTIAFTIKDEDTNTQITWDNITLELIGSLQAYNFTTTTGNYTATLLNPQSYTIRYYGTKYAERFYYFTLDNRTYNSLTLYAINNTLKSNVTINVIDEDANNLENAKVEALKYYLSSNSYVVQEIGTTDVNGNTILSLTKNDEFYKFIVLYNDVVVKTTTPAYVTGDFTIQVVIGGTTASNFYQWGSISSDLSFNRGSNNFRLDYVDASGLSTQICMDLYQWIAGEKSLINNSCSTSSTGTILIGVTPSNGTTYEAVSKYVDSNGDTTQLSRLSYTYPVTDVFGTTGVVMQVFLTMVLVLLTAWNLPLSVLMIPISLVIGNALRFNLLGWETIVGVFVMSLILLFIIRRRG